MKPLSLPLLACGTLLVLMVFTSCTAAQTQPASAPASTATLQTNLPNPASVYCEEQGNKLEIRTAADGSQSGACIFPDGSECDEWAYYRGECGSTSMEPTSVSPEVDSYGWKIYRNEALGYSFHYPAEAQLGIDDNPLASLSISGPGMGDEFWGISHPADREEYRPPEDADLLQWLTDHYLVGEKRMPDEQIAGTTAIHYRHDRSPQAYADDRYYFARSGQLYVVLIGHGSETEDWELNNRFLQSIQFEGASSTQPSPTAIPTVIPIHAEDYQGFWTYTHPVYGFSIMLPEDWVVDETTASDPLMNGHMLRLHPRLQGEGAEGVLIRMTFRRAGDETPLWPTGVGAGQFVEQGTLDVAGEPARRVYFVCPAGQVNEIWYHGLADTNPNLQRGDTEFGFISTLTGFYCQEGHSLRGKLQHLGEMIIASLKVP
jgi:putative hemolysin